MRKRSVFELAELYSRASVQKSELLRSLPDADLALVLGGVNESCLSAVNESCLSACNEAGDPSGNG